MMPQQPPYGYGQQFQQQRQKNGNASLSFWLGLASFVTCGLAGVPALILGLMAKKEMDAQPGRFSNQGQATGGIVLGAIGCGFLALAILGNVLGKSGAGSTRATGTPSASVSGASVSAGATTTLPAGTTVTTSIPAAPEVDPLATLQPSEKAFCGVIADYSRQYDDAKSSGANQLKLSKLRTQRKQAMLQAVNASVSGWTGKIDDLKTNSEGKASVVVKLPCEGGTIKTWNNALSDSMDGTLVPQSS
ncbi:MAG: DUF4190 domain-containing protein, partial [Polyangiaceae bacterium]